MSKMTELWYEAKGFITGRQRAYRLCFNTPAGRATLADLAAFCRAYESTWHDDPSKRDVLIGRREVWLRIQQHLHLSGDALTQMSVKPELRAFAPSPEDEG